MTIKSEPQTYPETYFAGAYWGPRKESPEECAQRTAEFLNLLAQCEPFLAKWYKPAKSRKDRRKHPLMPPDVHTLTEIFKRGANREKGGPIFEDLGFNIWIDNGGEKNEIASLLISCGKYAQGISNTCVLSLPTPGYAASADRVLTAPVLLSVVRSMALAYEPDWAVATSDPHRGILHAKGKTDAWPGWVTYLSQRRGAVPPLPAPVRIERVEDKGFLICLTPERFTVANPEHVALAQRVRELLLRAGLIHLKPPLFP